MQIKFKNLFSKPTQNEGFFCAIIFLCIFIFYTLIFCEHIFLNLIFLLVESPKLVV